MVHFELLRAAMEKSHRHASLFSMVTRGTIKFIRDIDWAQELVKDKLPRHFTPQVVIPAYMKGSPSPYWIFIAYILKEITDLNFLEGFKSNEAALILCQKCCHYLSTIVDDTDEFWDIDRSGLKLQSKVEEFIFEEGLLILSSVKQSYEGDDRLPDSKWSIPIVPPKLMSMADFPNLAKDFSIKEVTPLPKESSIVPETNEVTPLPREVSSVQPNTIPDISSKSDTMSLTNVAGTVPSSPMTSTTVSSQSNSNFLQNFKDVKLDALDKSSIEAFKDAIRRNKVQSNKYEFNLNYISKPIQYKLSNLWALRADEKVKVDRNGWKVAPEEEFFTFLDAIANADLDSKNNNAILDRVYKVIKKGLYFNPYNYIDSLDPIGELQRELQENNVVCTKEQLKLIDDLTFENLKGSYISPNFMTKAQSLKTELGPPTEDTEPFNFFMQLCRMSKRVVKQADELLDIGNIEGLRLYFESRQRLLNATRSSNTKGNLPNTDDQHRRSKDYKRKFSDRPSPQHSSSNANKHSKTKSDRANCAHCGLDNHVAKDCRLFNDKSIDRSLLNLDPSKTFGESDRGKFLISRGYAPRFMREREPKQRLDGSASATSPHRGKDKSSKNVLCYMSNDDYKTPLIYVNISCQTSSKSIDTTCLLDSGADVDYVNLNIVNNLNAHSLTKPCINCKFISGVQSSHSIIGVIDLIINYTCERNLSYTLTSKAHIVKDLSYHMILGHESIKNHNLILKYTQIFLNLQSLPRYWDFQASRSCGRMTAAETGRVTLDVESEENKSSPKESNDSIDAVVSSPAKNTNVFSRNTSMEETLKPDSLSLGPVVNHSLFHSEKDYSLYTMNRSIRSDFEQEDIHEIRDDQMESIPSEMLDDSSTDDNLPPEVHGTPSLQAKLRALILEYKDIFSRKVRKDPANLPPFNFSVDKEKWETHTNKTPPRRYDNTKSAAIQQIVDQLLSLGVIVPSDAAFYSHGFPVPKSKPGSWRLVIDLKNLNKISSTESWPIPNIKQLLQRLGSHQASFFAVMDLTMGYHQAPIDLSCQKYTAFRTDKGLYHWTRLAMGLQGAGSYFQRVMSTVVLPRLIHQTCELYLDDCIVPGKDEDSLVNRLRQVFSRFREHNITLHPDKCQFGLSEVEYVGVTINKEGTHFNRSKLDSILNFKEPTTQTELKSFLGFANWFRDHVRSYHDLAGPLYKMLTNYNRRTRLQWTDLSRTSYEKLKHRIHECPRLYFLDDISPIYLHTDASDYGIGAYLFQVVDGIEHPISFLSKSLDERTLRWDTPQKEGYAIFFALNKFDYLLRDRRFTVRTDHANLTKLKNDYSSNKKVQRWLTCFQHYDITFEYIKGSLNIVADTLSRHCINLSKSSDLTTSLNSQVLTIPPEYVTWIKEAHNSVVGHHGVDNTIAKLAQIRPNWPDRTKHVRSFISNCPCCQKMNQRRTTVHAQPSTASSYRPNQRIAIDYIERLTPDQYGHTAIFVAIDCFTRYIELYPVQEINAVTSAKCLLDWFTRYGSSNEITHDNGTSFINETVKELIKLSGSTPKLATAYSKEENPIVERANKEVMRHLRNIIFDDNVITSWSMFLPLVRRIMNSSIHASTGFTPASLMFGNSIDIDRGFLFSNEHTTNTPISHSEWIKQLVASQATLLDIARQNLTEKDEVHLQNYPTDRSNFDIGSYVLVEHRHNPLRRGPNSKLLPFLKGPMRVVSKKDNTYTLQDIVNLRVYDYHVKNLRVFNFDPTTQNPLEYALKDNGTMYQVERISKHKGDPKKNKSNLYFLVHWLGYDETTWEPWVHVRRTAQLHDYLRNHSSKAIRDLLPQNFNVENYVFSDEEDNNDTNNNF